MCRSQDALLDIYPEYYCDYQRVTNNLIYLRQQVQQVRKRVTSVANIARISASSKQYAKFISTQNRPYKLCGKKCALYFLVTPITLFETQFSFSTQYILHAQFCFNFLEVTYLHNCKNGRSLAELTCSHSVLTSLLKMFRQLHSSHQFTAFGMNAWHFDILADSVVSLKMQINL